MQKTGRDLPPFPNLRKFLDFLGCEDDLKTLNTPWMFILKRLRYIRK